MPKAFRKDRTEADAETLRHTHALLLTLFGYVILINAQCEQRICVFAFGVLAHDLVNFMRIHEFLALSPTEDLIQENTEVFQKLK